MSKKPCFLIQFHAFLCHNIISSLIFCLCLWVHVFFPFLLFLENVEGYFFVYISHSRTHLLLKAVLELCSKARLDVKITSRDFKIVYLQELLHFAF